MIEPRPMYRLSNQELFDIIARDGITDVVTWHNNRFDKNYKENFAGAMREIDRRTRIGKWWSDEEYSAACKRDEALFHQEETITK